MRSSGPSPGAGALTADSATGPRGTSGSSSPSPSAAASVVHPLGAGELAIVGPDARAGEPGTGEEPFDVRAVEIREDNRFQPDSGMKYGGPQRLRLLVAVPPGQRRLRFRYYLEVFGSVSLPGPPVGGAFRRRPLATTG
jgi:hypothetical protein